MNGPIDEKSFDEYLQRGSPVSQQYRALEREDVPSELDERILARASDAARSSRETARAWRRWSVPVALAASTVLVISIVLEGGVQDKAAITRAPAPSYAEIEVRESVTPAPKQSAPIEAPRPAPMPQESAHEEPALDRFEARERSAPRAQVPPPSTDLSEEQLAIESSASDAEASAAPPLAAIRREPSDQPVRPSAQGNVRPAGSTVEAQADRRAFRSVPPHEARDSISAAYERSAPEAKRADMDPDQWLDRIRALREAGRNREADREWEAFRKAYPDHVLDDADEAR